MYVSWCRWPKIPFMRCNAAQVGMFTLMLTGRTWSYGHEKKNSDNTKKQAKIKPVVMAENLPLHPLGHLYVSSESVSVQESSELTTFYQTWLKVSTKAKWISCQCKQTEMKLFYNHSLFSWFCRKDNSWNHCQNHNDLDNPHRPFCPPPSATTVDSSLQKILATIYKIQSNLKLHNDHFILDGNNAPNNMSPRNVLQSYET